MYDDFLTRILLPCLLARDLYRSNQWICNRVGLQRLCLQPWAIRTTSRDLFDPFSDIIENQQMTFSCSSTQNFNWILIPSTMIKMAKTNPFFKWVLSGYLSSIWWKTLACLLIREHLISSRFDSVEWFLAVIPFLKDYICLPSPRGHGIMDRASACGASSPRSIPATSKCFFSSRIKSDRKDNEPVMIKLHDLASPSRKNQVLALPSLGERCVSAGHGNKKNS